MNLPGQLSRNGQHLAGTQKASGVQERIRGDCIASSCGFNKPLLQDGTAVRFIPDGLDMSGHIGVGGKQSMTIDQRSGIEASAADNDGGGRTSENLCQSPSGPVQKTVDVIRLVDVQAGNEVMRNSAEFLLGWLRRADFQATIDLFQQQVGPRITICGSALIFLEQALAFPGPGWCQFAGKR